MYCLTIPFLFSGSGRSHESWIDVELSGDRVKLVGGPDGTGKNAKSMYMNVCH